MRESIAVVITCFNLERYIGDAILSVLAQDIGRDNIDEIVVVDDCSTDASASIIQAFPGVTYLRTPRNSGVLLATLAGIAATRSELVFFLDGDDIWEPTKLGKARQAFEGGVGLVTHDLTYIDAQGMQVAITSRVSTVMQALPAGDWAEAVRRGILMHDDYVWLGSAYAFRRSTADLDGFCRIVDALPDSRNTYQDWPLAFWVASREGILAGYVPGKLFRYRLHGANHSGDSTSPQKAIRNFRRAFNTISAINAIAKGSTVDPVVRHRVSRRVVFARYLVDLYEGRRISALRGLLESIGYIRSARLGVLREVLRFCGVAMLGVGGFTKTVSRFRSLRQEVRSA